MTIAVADLREIGRPTLTNRSGLFLKRDGTLLEGVLLTDEPTIQLDLGATLKGAYAGRFAWAFLQDGYSQLDRFANLAGSLEEVLRANLTLALVRAFSGETVENSLGMRLRRVKPGTSACQ